MPLVVMNAMPVEQRPKLLLKRFGPMMLPLVLDYDMALFSRPSGTHSTTN
jgi:hypothetical protein